MNDYPRRAEPLLHLHGREGGAMNRRKHVALG